MRDEIDAKNTLVRKNRKHKLTSVSIQSQEAADYPC